MPGRLERCRVESRVIWPCYYTDIRMYKCVYVYILYTFLKRKGKMWKNHSSFKRFFERKQNCALDYSWITDRSFFTSVHDSLVFLYLSHFVLSLLKLQTWFGSIPVGRFQRNHITDVPQAFPTTAISIRQRDVNNTNFFGRWAFRGAGKSAMATRLSRVGFWVPVWVPVGFFWKMSGVYMILPPLEIFLMLRKMIYVYNLIHTNLRILFPT